MMAKEPKQAYHKLTLVAVTRGYLVQTAPEAVQMDLGECFAFTELGEALVFIEQHIVKAPHEANQETTTG